MRRSQLWSYDVGFYREVSIEVSYVASCDSHIQSTGLSIEHKGFSVSLQTNHYVSTFVLDRQNEALALRSGVFLLHSDSTLPVFPGGFI